jgi:hypothetical protein
MTSVDSGVDTGNDSNDSYATFESQSTTREVGPVKSPKCVLYPAPATARELPNFCMDIKQFLYGQVRFHKIVTVNSLCQ